MNHLILLRHGRTEGNARHLYYGKTDLPLLPQTLLDLRAASARGVYPAPDGFSFVTSGMLRTEQTLRAIYGDVPFSVIEELREINFGIFEMKSYEELKDTPVYQAWVSGDWYRNVPPEGESFAECETRMLKGLARLLERAQDTICVCYIRQQGDVAGALDGDRQLTLMSSAGTSRTAGQDLAALRQVTAEFRSVFEIDVGNLVYAERANLLALARMDTIISHCHNLSSYLVLWKHSLG